MKPANMDLLRKKCGKNSYKKLEVLNNPKLTAFIAKYVELCDPDTVFVRTDSPDDAEYIRKKTIENGEEIELATKGHTIHFDGYNDQARDKANTKYLLDPEQKLGEGLNSCDRDQGLEEVHDLLKNSMAGKEMYICFLCLGPTGSGFSIPAVQITDSSYVAHSEGLLYRSGYEEFKRIGESERFFRFVHTAGTLDGAVSSDVKNRRIYIDLKEEMVFSTNTQYAGNTVGLKKLAMRLAIQLSDREGWLTEHMFVMGVYGPDNKRITYFTGAFPSACGKTATAMLDGEKIVGDDIAYIKKIDNKLYTVNVEKGIFGIIRDVNAKDDPVIFKELTAPGEVIFSNVLKDEKGNPRWLGDGREEPVKGMNFSGEWTPEKKGPDGKDVPCAHKNARYTIKLGDLSNCDNNLENPAGVEIGGVIYGGRDSNTSVPVCQSFDWAHGILTQAAALESETTAATLGQEGVRTFNLMANLDFLSIPIDKYIRNNLDIIKGVDTVPLVFGVNYFLKDSDGKYLNGIKDKHVWLKWMESRVNGEAKAIKTPVGYIPEYEDIQKIFKTLFNKEYTREQYEEQFKLRIPEIISKMERIKGIYQTKVPNTPDVLVEALDEQKKRLEECRAEYGDYVSPSGLIAGSS